MLWLALLRYAITGQAVWIQDGPNINDAWHCRVVAVLPGICVIEVANTRESCEDSPYTVVLPIDVILAVRERYPGGDVGALDRLYRGPSGESARVRR